MKSKILLFILLFSSLFSFGQRQRTTAVFDADTTTASKTGTYGIGVRDGQPWLIDWKSNTDAIRFKMEEKYIVGVQLSDDGGVEYTGGNYQGRKTQIVALLTDSITVDLPDPKDTANFYRNIEFIYFGFTDSLFYWYPGDNTYCVAFTDTIFAYDGNQTYFFLPATFIGSKTASPSVISRKIKPFGRFNLSVYDRRWYINFNGMSY